MSLGNTTLAEPVVKTIYGAKWVEVIPLLPWGMSFGVAAAMAHAAYMLLLASQRSNWCLMLDCVSLVGTAIALFAALPFGLVPYLLGVICLQSVICIFSAFLLLRFHSVAWTGLSTAILPSILSAIVALGVCEGLALLTKSDKAAFGVAFAYGLIFCLGYALVLRAFFQRHLEELVSYLPASQKIRNLLWLH